MNSSPHPVEQEELMAYLDGELTAERAIMVSEHIERCGDCRVAIAESRGFSERLAAWQIEPAPQSLVEHVNAAVAGHDSKPQAAKKRRPAWAFGLPRWVWATAGAACVVMLIAALAASNLLRSRRQFYLAGDSAPVTDQASGVGNGAIGRLPAPGVAPDSNGTLHGLGDHVSNSVSTDGQLSGETVLFTREQLANPASPPPPPEGKVAATQPVTNPMIARTASLKLLTKDFDQTRAALEAAIRRHGGYSAQLTVGSESGNVHTLAASFRVPADQLDATLTEIKQLAHVEQETLGGEEVTDQYVDLNARLSNARRTEQTLLDILEKRAGRLSDVLAVEQELANVREQIERMEAELKNLQNRVNFATLQVELREEYKAQLDMTTPSVGGRVRNALVEGYRAAADSLVGTILFLLNVGPFLLVWGLILFFPARFAWRKVRTAMKAN